MATPTVVTGSLSAQASGTTRVPVIPTHAADDILVTTAMCNVSDTISISGGWTEIDVQDNVNMSTGWWWKRAAGSSETNPTVTFGVAGSGTNIHAAWVMVVTGCVTSDTPYEGLNMKGSPTFDNAGKFGDITTLGTNRLVMGMLVYDALVSQSNTVLTGWTEDDNNGSAVGAGMAYFTLSKSEASITTVGELAPVNSPGTSSPNAYWRSATLAWRDTAPAGGGGSSITLHQRSLKGVGF